MCVFLAKSVTVHAGLYGIVYNRYVFFLVEGYIIVSITVVIDTQHNRNFGPCMDVPQSIGNTQGLKYPVVLYTLLLQA